MLRITKQAMGLDLLVVEKKLERLVLIEVFDGKYLQTHSTTMTLTNIIIIHC